MKKLWISILIILILLPPGCSLSAADYDITATTLPVYDFTSTLCENTGLSVGRLVSESVSCLHDYSLQISQMRMIESADLLVISGAGLEDFLDGALQNAPTIIDASQNVHLHSHELHAHDGHDHDNDPHIWLSTENAMVMAETICQGLSRAYPQFKDQFHTNLQTLKEELHALQLYGEAQLSELSCRELITFHDGFVYFAEGFDLTILKAIEEESGSEASAAEIIELIKLVGDHQLPAVFTEISGSDACAGILAAETNVAVFPLDMAMSGNSYFDAMYHNINTIKEALK